MLRGKHKPTVHASCGLRRLHHRRQLPTSWFSPASKLDQKLYRYHTGYPGGLKEITYRKLMQTKKHDFAFKEAVRRMLPKGPLGYAMLEEAARLRRPRARCIRLRSPWNTSCK